MKSKIIALALIAVFIASNALTAYAATPLSATCSGVPSTNSISWSSVVSGGVSPFTYLWSNGSTSSAQTVQYATPGVKVINLQVTDASSTIATANCSQTLSQNSTTTIPVKKMPKLHIEGNGNIETKAMTVKTVGTGSFTAEVWGITYTVTSDTPVSIGNYVDVVGKISATSPLTIVAKHVRDYPTEKVMNVPKKDSWFDFKSFFKQEKNDDHGKNKGKGKGNNDD